MLCLYEILQVSPRANDAVIKSAYRTLAHLYHPDHHPGDAKAEASMKQINHAYDILSDLEKRAQYDLQHGHAALAPIDAVVTPATQATEPEAHYPPTATPRAHRRHRHQPSEHAPTPRRSPWLLRMIIFVAAAIFSVMAGAKWIMSSDPRMALMPAQPAPGLSLQLDRNAVPTPEK